MWEGAAVRGGGMWEGAAVRGRDVGGGSSEGEGCGRGQQ